MATRTVHLCSLLLLLVAQSQSPVQATVVFSTFGPGLGYDPTVYMPVNFYTTPEIIGTQLAFAFDVAGTRDLPLQAVELAASWDGTKENARFTLHGDAAGIPAEVPLAVLGDNPPALPRYPGIGVLTLHAPAPVTLAHGERYWLSIAPASLDASIRADDFVMLWLSSPERTVIQTARNSFGGGPWEPWFTPAFDWSAPAFRVLATETPEPTSLTLLLVAVPAVAIARRQVSRRRIAKMP